MTRSLRPSEIREQSSLLIEAVTLLVERQRETESRIAAQISLADERAAAAERRYAELAGRLAEIETRLTRLFMTVEAAADGKAIEDRLERLRAEVEGLKSGLAAGAPLADTVAAPPRPRVPEPQAEDLLGTNRNTRARVLLMAIGAVAVLYAILTQLRLS